MNGKFLLKSVALLLLPLIAGGCATAARDTTGFALQHSTNVDAPADDVWQAVKSVLRERGLDIYTRDKRGKFVAYSDTQRRLFIPQRTKHTIEIVEDTPGESALYIDTVRQVYGVTLLTYPDWHDRRTNDESEAVAILQAIEAKFNGPVMETPEVAPVPEAVEAAPVS